MPDLFSPGMLEGKTVRNRTVMPPMVCFHWAQENGGVSPKNVAHYALAAKTGIGLIIVEACAVKKDGRLSSDQLGIWEDAFIPGLAQLTDACRPHGTCMLVQIHHAGLKTPQKVNDAPAGPSADERKPGSRALEREEIEALREAFISAAVRAKQAGFDGVELHGAHGYLLDQFVCSTSNRRTDEYGGTLENRLRLSCEIIKGVRRACGSGFIIGYRLGANIPTLEEGVAAAGILEKAGVSVIHVSNGVKDVAKQAAPWEYPYNYCVYMAAQVKKHVGVPVIAVNEIKTPQAASWLIENGLCDYTAIGRGLIADPLWFEKAQRGEPVNECLNCAACQSYKDLNACVQRRKADASR